MQLPNQATTWGRPIESFSDWRARQASAFATEATAITLYLLAQIKEESEGLAKVRFNNPILGLLAFMGEQNNRAQELMYACLALTVAGDEAPARALIEGRRLNLQLHPEYVERTRCYG